MKGCSKDVDTAPEVTSGPAGNAHVEEVLLASRQITDDLRQTVLSVPGIHCGSCMRAIEGALRALDHVEHARVNLSTKRVAVHWHGETPPPFIQTLTAIGFPAHLHDNSADEKDPVLANLLRALAVAGFAAMNIMLLSVAVWSGAETSTRNLFHWISAAIALPALFYSGRIFFRSAWSALRNGRTNMDVPISVGVILAFGLSICDTIQGDQHAYFDASVALIFFLLIGRTLDHMMRERARTAVKGLAKLSARGATAVREDGSTIYLPVSEIRPGANILLAAGERVPVDSEVEHGTSDLDCSIVSGESEPFRAEAGACLKAGTLNLTGPLRIRATAAADRSFLAEMIQLMEAAEGGRARYRRMADRVVGLYSPVVHLTALATFLGWMFLDGDWHQAISIAIAVLIITCPCALGLAVPIVQVVAARRLFESGVMVKDGSAMERLADVDTAVFDKTGTLTLGRPHLVNVADIARADLRLAAAIASHSRHPLSKALASHADGMSAVALDNVAEIPGSGVEARWDGVVYRFGRADWAVKGAADQEGAHVGTVLARDGRFITRFVFEDRLREDAATALADLQRKGLCIEILSGDRTVEVTRIAAELGVATVRAGALPREKVDRIRALTDAGHKVLMVGDGLNDAPALAAAHVSIAPATAADIGRNAADLVFLRESLAAVPLALEVSRASGRLIRQNLALAIGYNAVAIPVAVLGYVTPLVAALAMSGSSLVVVANALRLRNISSPRRVERAENRQPPLVMEPAE
ncbi:cadmium-translocating P-type ATPase [Aurantimonas sp. DM33-3]|uniref:cation-translocating P-type ATPase n=1 Tax=Aurantimonas sp. DM33-3 TaxID=2766955 RepID=UPI001651BEB9|nr:cation-translocating P-type ATPase [Aurantimonas sp. DM33-3]MBC6718726.1 cadmium-translocating P-type ATPase [Aurantimonas sp. DM33-3]